jgi:nucleoside-diphosphate-sugar epimerase
VKTIVTGAAGFIGSHLCERLLADGWWVTGVDSFAPTYGSVFRRDMAARLSRSRSFEFVEGDLIDLDLRNLISDADVVFHLAARPGVRASWDDFARASNANVLATQRVLDAVANSRSARLVFASSSSVYGQADVFPTSETSELRPISPYGVTKAACESLVGAYASQAGVNAASLRYFTVYGPRQRSDMAFTKWIRAGLRGDPLPIYGDGSAVRDFTFVSDVVDATYRVGQLDIRGHEIFNVAGGSPASITNVLEIIEELVERRLELEFTPVAKGDPARTGGDTRALQERTGWEPTVDLEDGLRAQVDWIADPLSHAGDGR